MINFLKRLFGRKTKRRPAGDEAYEQDYVLKTQGLEAVLGKMHDMVGHAIIPFSVGGAVDMYYFPHHLQGTGFATMELIEPDGTGPMPNVLGTYELVAFTRHPLNTNDEVKTEFNTIERHVCGIFTRIGSYSFSAMLNPGDTCELPRDGEETICLIFDAYRLEGKPFMIGDREHHLLLCMELFRSEMEFSRANGSEKLFELLDAAGYYPYCDMDRKAVV